MIPTLEDDLQEGWQERAIERRAQQLASKLVEELYQERAEQMERRARDNISGTQPCECLTPPSPNVPPQCKTKFDTTRNMNQSKGHSFYHINTGTYFRSMLFIGYCTSKTVPL